MCSEECEKILQLRLDRMEEQKLREYEELNESKKLQKAGLNWRTWKKYQRDSPRIIDRSLALPWAVLPACKLCRKRK